MGNLPLNIDIQQILLHLLNFVILFALMYFILYKPVRNFMNKREEYYKKMDEDAKAASEDAAAKKTEAEEKLGNIDAEISAKLETSRKDTASEREKILTQAKEEADSIVKKSREKALEEHDRIIADAQKDIAQIVDEATAKIVMDSEVDSYDEFLNAVGRD